MIGAVLVSAVVALFLVVRVCVPLMLYTCVLCSTRIRSAAEATPASLCILIVLLVVSATCIYVVYRLLICSYCLASERFFFHSSTVFFHFFSTHRVFVCIL